MHGGAGGRLHTSGWGALPSGMSGGRVGRVSLPTRRGGGALPSGTSGGQVG
jgi:hypothetical protein